MIGNREHRIGGKPPGSGSRAVSGKRLVAGFGLLMFGFLGGYLVGLVTGEDEQGPLDVAIAPSAGPIAEAVPVPGELDEPPSPSRAPTADDAGAMTPLSVPSEPPPRRDIAAAKLPIAPPSDAVTDGATDDLPPTEPAIVAIVIDDLGLLEAATESAIALDPSFTLSFLPYGEKAGDLAAKARAAGHEVLLHMPMEPDGPVDPGPDALLTSLAADEIRARLGAALERVPQAMGLNNHMGSRFTADAEAIAVVLDEVSARGMMMLDSVTTPDSVIGDLAEALDVPNSARDVFLDNDRDPALINQQLDELERLARATGRAIALCHPYRETIAVLRAWLPAAERRGIRLVPLSRLATPQLRHPMIAAQLPGTVDDQP